MINDDELDRARRELYRLPPDEFLSARTALAKTVTDPDLSKAIGALRKPTAAAWIVNVHVHSDPTSVDRLADLGNRLRQAHSEAEATGVRALSLERRRTVAEIVQAAVTGSGRASVSQTVRDEVTATFDAAVADPDIARRLGALQRSQSWSGFGLESVAGPGLTLVPGGGSPTTPRPRTSAGPASPDRTGGSASDAAPAPDSAELDAARERLDAAEADLSQAEAAEETLGTRIRKLTTRLTTIQHELDQARRDLAEAKRATSTARRARRSARSGLDRIERHQ